MANFTRTNSALPNVSARRYSGSDGDLVHQVEEGVNPCTPSVDVVISKSIIELLSAGERLYVNPVKNANRTLAPSFIFLHKDQQLRPFINTDYQPAGATEVIKGTDLVFSIWMSERLKLIRTSSILLL